MKYKRKDIPAYRINVRKSSCHVTNDVAGTVSLPNPYSKKGRVTNGATPEEKSNILSDIIDGVSVFGICFISVSLFALIGASLILSVNVSLGLILIGALTAIIGASASLFTEMLTSSEKRKPRTHRIGKYRIIILIASLVIGASVSVIGAIGYIENNDIVADKSYSYIYENENLESSFETDADGFCTIIFSPKSADNYIVRLKNADLNNVVQLTSDNISHPMSYQYYDGENGGYDNCYCIYLIKNTKYEFKLHGDGAEIRVKIEKMP